MTIYLVYRNTVQSKLAVSLFLVSTVMSKLLNSNENNLNVEAVEMVIGCPMPFEPKPLDIVYFIDIPISAEEVSRLDELGVVVTLIGQHNGTYEHFGISKDDYWSVKENVSTVMLAYNAFSTQLSSAPSVVKELNKEILSGKIGPLQRYFETLLPLGSKPALTSEFSFYSDEPLKAGWILLRDDENDLTLFKKMDWGKPANFEDTEFIKGMVVKPLAMQYPGPNADRLIKGILDDGDVDLIITWLITVERVTFSVYSTNNAALAICERYYPTGTPWESGFSLSPKAGLSLISKLIAK